MKYIVCQFCEDIVELSVIGYELSSDERWEYVGQLSGVDIWKETFSMRDCEVGRI